MGIEHVIKTALLWVIKQRIVVISCRRFGGTIPTVCLETSVINYHYSSRNNTEDCSSHPILRVALKFICSSQLVRPSFHAQDLK